MRAKGVQFYDDIWRLLFQERKSSRRLSWERARDLASTAAKHVVGTVLDLGCGFGFLAEFVKGRYLGVDFSPYVVRKAQALNPDAEFLVADIRDLPPVGQFDTVVLLEVLEHLDDPARAVESIRQSARKKIVASVPRGKSRSEDHVWKSISRDDMIAWLGSGTVCRQYRRKWLAVWECMIEKEL